MKKYFLLILFVVLCLPVMVNAESIEIDCDKKEVKNNEEITCQVLAKEMTFKTTSVSGKIVLDENLKLISSDFSGKDWKILDLEFDISNMNLISERIIEESDYTIATFKVKAVSEKTIVSKIKLTDVLIGDENYVNHPMTVEDYSIYVENEKVVNPSTGIDVPILVFVCVVGIGVGGFNLIRKKKYI